MPIDRSTMDRPSKMKRLIRSSILFVIAAGYCFTGSGIATAATFSLPTNDSTIVGRTRTITDIRANNTLLDIMRHFDVGYEEITRANPGVSTFALDQNQKVVVPTEFILPPKPWEGIVVNMPQRRLYFFPKAKDGETPIVITFPVSIFREGWPTPLGKTRIINKEKDPSWTVPKSIQTEHQSNGETAFPSYFPPGPDNPMGMLAMETGFPAIFIHGTNKPWGVGMRTSHGCIHLYPEDAAQLFPILPVGTPVRITNESYVVGQRDGQLYLTAYETLTDYPSTGSPLTNAVSAVTRALSDKEGTARRSAVDWDRVTLVAQDLSPIPASIAPGGPSLQKILSGINPETYHFAPYGRDANNAVIPEAPKKLSKQ